MPRVGIYPLWENDLMWFFQEHYPAVSNRELLHDVLLDPIIKIRDGIWNKEGHPYILRERHRKWCNQVGERIYLTLPTWEQTISQEFWEHDDCPLCVELFQDMAEWCLFGDDADAVYRVLEQLYDSLTMEGTARAVVGAILASPEGDSISELYVADSEDGHLYVIRSPRVEPCGDFPQAHPGLNVADALIDGPHETYVLPEKTLEELSKWITANAPEAAK